MAFGIELRNSDTNLVLDEDNPVVVVTEKGTRNNNTVSSITSVNDDSGGWYKIDSEDTWFSTIVLSSSYSTPPILAIRNGGGGYGGALPKATVYKHNSTDYNRIRMYSPSPTKVEWIICASSSTVTPTVDSTQDYGIEIKDSSNNKVFDSRWVDIVSLVDIVSMPDISLTISGAGTQSLSTSPASSDVTVANSPGSFYAVSGLSGVKSVSEYEMVEPGFSFIYGGGNFIPTVAPVNDTTLKMTAIRASRGPVNGNASSGILQDANAEYGGQVLILRYLNF